MKKFTLFIALLVCAVGFSQRTTNVSSMGENNPVKAQAETIAVVTEAAAETSVSYNAISNVEKAQNQKVANIIANIKEASQETNANYLAENNPIIDEQFSSRTASSNYGTEADCSQSNPSNAFENGRGFNAGNGWTVANDFIVPMGNDMMLNQLIVYAFNNVGATILSADITIYDDAAGLPGAVVTSETLVPTSETYVGTNFGFDMDELVFDLTPVALAGDAGTDLTFWVAIQVTCSDGGPAYWETSTASVVGNPHAFDDGTGFTIPDATSDGVYTFVADCTPIGGGGGCDIEEDFDAGLPAGWSTHITSGTCDFQNGADLPTGDDFTTPGMFFDDDACDNGTELNDAELWSATYDLDGATAIQLTCDVAFQESTDGENFGIDVWDGGAWQAVALYEDDLDPDIQTVTFDVTGMANEFFTVRWRYRDAQPSWGWHGGVDNFCLDYTAGGGGGNDCSQTNPSNAFENGRGFNAGNGWTVATDVIVPMGDDMMLNQLSVMAFNNPGATILSADITIYDDAAGLPGSVVTSETLAPTSETYVGTNFGFDMDELIFDLTPVALAGDAGTDVSYWVAIQVTCSDGGPAYWENSTASAVGQPQAFDDGTGFTIPDATLDSVYTFVADCTPIGGGGSDCSETNPSNAFENGRGFNAGNGWTVATDVTVPMNNDMELTQLSVMAFNNPGATILSADITIYDDAAGLPGAVVTSETLVPTSETYVGTNFGFDMDELIFDITPVNLAGDVAMDVTYWVAIQVTCSDGGPAYWENTTASMVGNPQAFDDGTGFTIPDATLDSVYTFVAECSSLGTSDNTIEGFSYYPNPATNELNLSSQENIERVSIYNILGQKVVDLNVNATSTQLNVDHLTTGTYIMKVSVDGQEGTYKIIKN